MPNEPWQSPETQPTIEPVPPQVTPPVPAQEPTAEPTTAPVAEPELVTAPTPAPAAPAASDNVWVSKEEYERLRQAEVAQQQAQPVAKQKGPVSSILIVALAVAAVIFIGSLIGGHVTIFTAFAFALFALTGFFTMRDYTQAKREGYVREHKARNITLLVVGLSVILLPVVGVVVMFILFFVACGSGGCRGS